ncbi:MAG: T9SS type A sorting domain-containing protein [Ignavibacteriales bacterium]|nr:T9SS type A sorting domain-containing protein [Ignavibacteriales bacterium]
MNSTLSKLFVLLIITFTQVFMDNSYSQQININRISLMPDFPQPYLMRDWERATLGYDSLVFNQNLTGDYLPLIFFLNNTVNYPGDISFGLHTVVGTTSPSSGEAINVLPAVIGASLVGVDKSNQNGYNWVKMCREYFNNRPEQNVYKNHPVDNTYDDWWYETMPNVFFYQLYDLYPITLDFDLQLRSVADQWLKAVEKMGGKATPWNVPYMNYRGFDLSNMTPYDLGVKEPESAGALAWILFNAYKKTGEVKYRIGAEWSMEFLNGLITNPSYELQLPYGTYIAAKMNAELGTNYDVEKMVYWCFNVGQLRSWGSIVGTWGGLDVSGLIGEVNGSNDYPFLMNTFEQASALVPMVRYDERFANAIGKWMLNAANASRLFYTKYLPDNKQDSEEWSHQYDSNSYIGHEAMRQSKYGASPYTTGDAIDGNWGATNLALYGSSHVGIFGGIIDTTNVEGILKLDLTKTDYFNESYPSYLFYNPYTDDQIVDLNVGNDNIDLYESISNNFISIGVSGVVQISIPAKSSLIIVLTPSGIPGEFQSNKFILNGIVVDYNSGQILSNMPPRIKALAISESAILKGDSITVYCTAVDIDGDNLSYIWQSEEGTIIGNDKNANWKSPNQIGEYKINVLVNDNNGGSDSAEIYINVIESFNDNPQILNFNANPRKIDLGKETEITCNAEDIDGDELIYEWKSKFGSISGIGKTVTWSAPNASGNYFVSCKVTDGKGGEAADSISISVRDFSIIQSGNLICFYPFTGNANDESGNNNGIISGATSTSDRFGNNNSALSFDGVNDNVTVANTNSINFTKAITINLWVNISTFFEREQYVISHGNWERRWKISISNNRLRWTIKTTAGVTDLDSETLLSANTLYNITVIYSGSEMEIYLNGKLDAFKNWTGDILAANIDLTIAQTIPGETSFNFKGTLDDIRIYDYALSLEKINELYDFSTNIVNEKNNTLPTFTRLYQNYPNPFNGQTQIEYDINSNSEVSLIIYDLLGRRMNTLVNEAENPGKYSVTWDSKDSNGNQLASGIYFIRFKANNYFDTKKIILLQ